MKRFRMVGMREARRMAMARAELSDRERLQPSLLDRLTDRQPGEVKDSASERFIDIRRLRDIILRDLSWLLNTSDNSEIIDSDLYPHAAKSTLNYGISDIAGRRIALTDAETLQDSIKQAVHALEPRIIPGTLEVIAAKDKGNEAKCKKRWIDRKT